MLLRVCCSSIPPVHCFTAVFNATAILALFSLVNSVWASTVALASPF